MAAGDTCLRMQIYVFCDMSSALQLSSWYLSHAQFVSACSLVCYLSQPTRAAATLIMIAIRCLQRMISSTIKHFLH